MKGLVSLLFVLMSIVIVFLGFQVVDNSKQCKAVRLSHQERLKGAARVCVQSATQNHPGIAYEDAIISKYNFDEVVRGEGGMLSAERQLKLPKGRLEFLKKEIYTRYRDAQIRVNDKIIDRYPDLDYDINHDAELASSKSKRKNVRKRRKH